MILSCRIQKIIIIFFIVLNCFIDLAYNTWFVLCFTINEL